MRRVTKVEEIVFKKHKDHGDQAKADHDEEENLPWQEEAESEYESGEASGPASACSEYRDEAEQPSGAD